MRFGHLLPHLHSPHWVTALANSIGRAEHRLAQGVRRDFNAATHTIGGMGAAIGGLERRVVHGVQEVEHRIVSGEHAVVNKISGGARWVEHEVQGVGQAIGGVGRRLVGDASAVWSGLEKVGQILPVVMAGGGLVLLARAAR